MTALQTPKKQAPEESRADSVRKRRSSQPRSKPDSKKSTQTTRPAYRTGSLLLPGKPQPVERRSLRQVKGGAVRPSSVSRLAQTSVSGRMINTLTPNYANKRTGKKNSHRNGYDFGFSMGRTTVRAPALSLPRLSPRWISAGITLLLGILLYTMWTANTFLISGAEVSGNQRLDAAQVSSALGMIGQPIFQAIPSKIEKNLRTAFPDLADVSVKVGLPNHIQVAVVERTPILLWSQDGNTTWIDANGVSFTPRGNVQGLIPIASNGNPPNAPVDSTKSVSSTNGNTPDGPFIAPAMVQAIVTLFPQVPAGAPMIYDPNYGMGWQDPRGWSVYFGQNTQDIPMKQKVYQAILDTITQQGIQPTLISVEYLDAPFYK